MGLTIKPKKECRWDIVSLGEIMLRLDPGDRRIATARSFEVCEGGGEYNVARGLKRCFGLDAAVVTAFADDPVGRLLQDFVYQGGVDSSLIRWVEHDGSTANGHGQRAESQRTGPNRTRSRAGPRPLRRGNRGVGFRRKLRHIARRHGAKDRKNRGQ